MNCLDIDELVEFINNKGARKEDLPKTATGSKRSAATAKGGHPAN